VGYTSTLLMTVRQPVPLDERDRLVKVRQHSSSEQPGHTRTADNGSLSELAHRHFPHVYRLVADAVELTATW